MVRRDIEHAGQAFRAYGLNTVFAYPALRRHGSGTEVVRFATARIRQAADADIAVLFTTPGTAPFYERNCWQAMPSTEFLIGDRSSPARHRDLAMMLLVSPKGQRHRSAFEHASVYFGQDAR